MSAATPTSYAFVEVTLECLPRLSEVLNIRREHIGPSYIQIRRKGGKNDRVEVTPGLRADLLARATRPALSSAGTPTRSGPDRLGTPPRRATRRQPADARPTRAHISGHPPTQQGGSQPGPARAAATRHRGQSPLDAPLPASPTMLEAGVNPRTIQRAWPDGRRCGCSENAATRAMPKRKRRSPACATSWRRSPLPRPRSDPRGGAKNWYARTNGPQNAASWSAVKAVDSGGWRWRPRRGFELASRPSKEYHRRHFQQRRWMGGNSLRSAPDPVKNQRLTLLHCIHSRTRRQSPSGITGRQYY